MRVEGQVFKIYSKDFRGKTNYTIKLEDNPIYYRCWQNRYAGIAEPGNKIAFDAEPNPDGQSAKVTSTPVLVAAQPPAAAATPVSGGGYGDRQGSIIYQSSRKDAIEFVKLAVEQGALVLPAKKAAKLGALEAAVDRYTAFFFEDVNTLGAVTREAEGGGGPVEGDDEEGDDE